VDKCGGLESHCPVRDAQVLILILACKSAQLSAVTHVFGGNTMSVPSCLSLISDHLQERPNEERYASRKFVRRPEDVATDRTEFQPRYLRNDDGYHDAR
jgi:hypothetical protein